MKRVISLSVLFAVLLSFSGCLKDSCKRSASFTFYAPVYKTKAQVRNNIKSNPAKAILNPGKLFIQGNYIFLNDVDKGIHVIDNSNPASPQNVAFIDIPGNVDLAIKGNTLYADLYTDLVTLDVSDPLHVSLKKVSEGVFPYRNYGFAMDTSMIITDWVKHDTVVDYDCNNEYYPMITDAYTGGPTNLASSYSGGAGSSPVGRGGSMARFAIIQNRLYTVSYTDISSFNISNINDPVHVSTTTVTNGWNIETIFPMRDKLFIGSSNGMFIYDVTMPDHPQQTGQFQHVASCDPVIADDDYAYVTLRSGTMCQVADNQLDILSISNLSNPVLVKSYPFTNPHGLSKDGDLLFICDGRDGLKIFNAANVQNLMPVKSFSGIDTYDVIAFNNRALVVAKDGLYQYDYSNPNNIVLLSKITIAQ